MSNINYSLDFELSDNNYIPNLFGVDDKNIHIIEKINNVQIKYRGNKIKIIGNKSSIKDTKEDILLLFEEAKKGIDIDEDKIMESRSLKILEINQQDQMDLFFQTKKRKISPRTQNQKDYFQLLNSKDIVFAYKLIEISSFLLVYSESSLICSSSKMIGKIPFLKQLL